MARDAEDVVGNTGTRAKLELDRERQTKAHGQGKATG